MVLTAVSLTVPGLLIRSGSYIMDQDRGAAFGLGFWGAFMLSWRRGVQMDISEGFALAILALIACCRNTPSTWCLRGAGVDSNTVGRFWSSTAPAAGQYDWRQRLLIGLGWRWCCLSFSFDRANGRWRWRRAQHGDFYLTCATAYAFIIPSRAVCRS